MKNKSFFKNEIQFNKNVIIKNIIITMSLAFVCQMLSIYKVNKDPNLFMLDFYILNDNFFDFFTSFLVWLLPLYISYICGSQFLYFSNLKEKLFNRVNRKNFILKRALVSSVLGFLFTLLFYLFCFIFLVVVFKTASFRMDILVSFKNNASTLFPYIYFESPILYLLVYIFIISMFGSVFSLIGFYTSLYIPNKIFVFMIPFILMIVFSVFTNFTPLKVGGLFDYTNIGLFMPLTFTYFSKQTQLIVGFISPFIFIFIFLLLIIIKANKDYN